MINVDSYQIIDDLDLLSENVEVSIVTACFTPVMPDWSVQDETNAAYILNKPTKTSDFINDGENGSGQYAELSNLPDYVKVNDVKVKYPNQPYVSFVEDRIGKIDLSNLIDNETIKQTTGKFVVASMKDSTGIITPENVRNKVDKVFGETLTPNKYTTPEKEKVSKIIINGDGTEFLTSAGTYKSVTLADVGYVTPKLKTNNITTQTPLANEDITGTINLHKVSKTGSFNDLLDTDIIIDNVNNLIEAIGILDENLDEKATKYNNLPQGAVPIRTSEEEGEADGYIASSKGAATGGTIVIRQSNGTIKITGAVNDDEAVVKSQLSDFITATSYASSTVGGTIKMRFDENTGTLYIRNDGMDA